MIFLEASTDTSLSAGLANMCMGMGTVFAVLIFIALIISLFNFIPKIQASLSKNKADAKAADIKPVAPVPKKAPKASDNLVNDAQLVAVITAAIYAANGSAGATSKDQLIVRSIRRAK